jgi:hypothetical protein
MNIRILSLITFATISVLHAQQEGEKVALKIELPKPSPGGTPKDVRSSILESEAAAKNRGPIMVPSGTKVLSKDCKVTSSDTEPIGGDFSLVTDGLKEQEAGAFLELGPGTQWIQIDLGKEKQIYAACVWHHFWEQRVYRDVICQVSNDQDFIDTVHTVFNNDNDNSSKLGAGKDFEYRETHMGRPFPINAIRARYVRFYSRGNTSDALNHYTEVEIYGKD